MANEAAEALLHQYSVDLVGRPLEAVLPSEAALVILAAAQLASRQEVPVTRTVRLSAPAGPAGETEGRLLEVTCERVQVDPESAPGVLLCLRDLDPASNEDWFQRGAERRDRQLAALSHSLLHPVAALRGYVELLSDELPNDPRTKELCSALDLQAEWLQSRLETLALMDQFRAKSVVWRDQEATPSALVDRAFGRVRSRLVARGIECEDRLRLGTPPVQVDIEKWVLVLSYLMDEVAYHLEGTGRLVVEERPRRSGGERLVLRIRAEAAAAPAAGDAPDPHRLEELLRATGLAELRLAHGMPLARTVIHHYGGTILWDWEPGGTAAVTLTLPLAAIRPRAGTVPEAAKPGEDKV